MTDEPIEVRTDEVELPFILARHWILLYPIDPRARLLYQLLAMHINVARGDNQAGATKADLAAMMGFKKADSLDKWLDVLYAEKLVTVRKKRTSDGLRDRNEYTLRTKPPQGYDGCLSSGDFYRRNPRNKKSAAQSVPPSSGVRRNGTKGKTPGRAVPPSTGVRTPVQRGQVPPSSGVELDVLELDELKDLKRERRASEPAQRASGPRSHPLPEDFALTDAMRRMAASTFPQLDVDYETAQFRDHYLADGSRRANWPTEWQKWMRRSAKYASERATRTPKDRSQRAQAATDAMFEGMYQRAVVRDAQREAGVAVDVWSAFA